MKKDINNYHHFSREKIPENIDDFMFYVEKWIGDETPNFKKFLGVNKGILIKIKESTHFTYSPFDNEIVIPVSFIKIFHKKLIEKNTDLEKSKFNFSFEDLKFSVYHELSHFRDLIFGTKQSKKNAMLNILKDINTEKIKFGNDKFIPIGRNLHDIYNCIDDVIVNTEVQMDIGANTSKEHLNSFYKYNLFADVIKTEGGSYKIEEGGLDYVGLGNGTHEINTTDEVDYSKFQYSKAFPYYYLRSFMVSDQKILLPKEIETILYNNESRTSKKSWSKSIKTMIDVMKNHFNNLEKSGDEKTVERCQKLKMGYLRHIHFLENILNDKKSIEKLLKEAIFLTNSTRKTTPVSINLDLLIKLFTLSTGKEAASHQLDISSSLRYELYRKIFLPLQKGFILMDLLKEDIKDSEEKSNGQSDGENSNSDENKGEGKGEINTGIHHSPDLEEKIKLLEELEQVKQNEQLQKEVEKKQRKAKYDVNSILESSGAGKEGIEAMKSITSKYNKEVEELVDFFIEQLYKIDKIQTTEIYNTKKGKLNVNNLINYIGNDPSTSELYKQKLYNRKNHIEKISKQFKKIDLTLAIDISGSCNQFKGIDGMMNIIPTILFVVMKHIEVHLQNILEDQNYQIPVNYVLYGDGKPFTSFNNLENSNITIAELNQNIISLSGGTNDANAWKSIAGVFHKKMQKDIEYVEEIKENKRKPIIIQIADSDVSENGVKYVTEEFYKYIGNKQIVNSLPIKRLILGAQTSENITQEDFIERQKHGEIGNWDPVFLDNGKVLIKETSIYGKKDIIEKIKKIFNNFFDDINY